MSAFLVCREHIDVLVRLAISGPSDGEDPSRLAFPVRIKDDHGRWVKVAPVDDLQHPDLIDPSAVGLVLWEENSESLACRYANDERSYTEDYEYRDPGFAPTCAEAAKALACLAYQSCEHPQWNESMAAGIVQTLREAVLSVLPGADAAPWAWSTAEVAARRSGVAR